MLSEIDKTCIDIIGVFENGKPGVYGHLVAVSGDAGGLSGGLLMASMNSGNLGKLMRAYSDAGGMQISEEEIQQTEAMDPSQNTDRTIREMFAQAAKDPIMQEVQDDFFYEEFLIPAYNWCAKRNFVEPLTRCVAFDGIVHGKFYGAKGFATTTPGTLPERAWVSEYLRRRRGWFETNSNPVLRRCTYRPKFFQDEIARGNWNLERPLSPNGFTI